MDRKSTEELQEHMMGTYYGLRVGLAVIGIGLPLVVLFAGGVLHHVWLEPSISQYYHTPSRLSSFTTRDIFVGSLFAAGACLYLYKGFSTRENVALNLAGVFALFVALLPTAATPSDNGIVSKLHGTSAVLFFLCIAYVSLFRSRDTLLLLPPAKRRRYARGYFWTGLAMIASPLAAVALSFALEPTSGYMTIIFWVETFAVWSFAAYWIIKTGEMRETKAEKRAMDAELKREVVTAASPEAAASPVDGVPSVVGPKSAEVEAVVPRDSVAKQ
ncbi:MAG: hypothetical protein M3430_07770 [Acidobacteriota bacterium]|nr:hypothetical protein [Acidobacteriota bacterium]